MRLAAYEPMKTFPGKYQGVFLILLIAAIYAAIQYRLPHNTFWSNDGGEKLIQVKALIDQDFGSISIPYDPLGVEPAGSFTFAPMYPVHARIINDHLVAAVPFYFPLLSSLPYLIWGDAGLYLLPFAGAIIILWCLNLLCRDHFGALTTALTLIGAGLSTSLFFYSLTFWEHIPATALCLTAIVLLYSSQQNPDGGKLRITVAGFIMSLGAWIRGDVYFLIVGLAIGLIAVRQYRRTLLPFLGGLVAGLIPFYLINHLLYATTTGPQVTKASPLLHSTASWTAFQEAALRQWDTIRYFLLSYTGLPAVDLVIILTALIPLFFLRKNNVKKFDLVITAWSFLLVIISYTTLIRLFFLRDPMLQSTNMLGLLAAIPFLPFAFVRLPPAAEGENSAFTHLVLITVLATLVGYCVGLPSRGGLQWGPRYTLPLFPLLIFLSMRGFDRVRTSMSSSSTKATFTALFILLIISGIGIQSYGIHLLAYKKQATTGNLAGIRSMAPPVLITDTWWVPEDNGDLYPEIPMYTFYDRGKMNRLLTGLAGAGEPEFLLASPEDYRHFLDRQPRLRLISFKRITHPDMPMFNLNLHKIRLTVTSSDVGS